MSYLNWFKFWRQFNWDTAYFHYTPYFFSLVNTPIPFIEVDHMSYNDDLGRPRRALTIHNPDLVQTLTMNWWYLCDILWIQCWHQWRRKARPSRGSSCRPQPRLGLRSHPDYLLPLWFIRAILRSRDIWTRNSEVGYRRRPRDALCQSKSCQLLHTVA